MSIKALCYHFTTPDLVSVLILIILYFKFPELTVLNSRDKAFSKYASKLWNDLLLAICWAPSLYFKLIYLMLISNCCIVCLFCVKL
jgi:hypothetical protein